MVPIASVDQKSPAEKAGIRKGDRLLTVNGVSIRDVLDYRFYATDADCTVGVERDGTPMVFQLHNREYQELGLEFDTYLMDEKKRCSNNCIFCFIDQNPPGMRETIYFKDDDERLSFLQGNYVTLTNLRDEEVQRIIRMHISPINVSVHTMNPELRVQMMRNRFAGEKLKYLKQLDEGGIRINAQLVLCRGINDGKELEFSLDQLCGLENLESLAVVPCGVTAYRDQLYPIQPYDAESASSVIAIVEKKAEECLESRGNRLTFASDEFYLLAGKPIPEDECYEDYSQLENGVGMLRLHSVEFYGALEDAEECIPGEVSIATGFLAYQHIRELADAAMRKFPALTVHVYRIRNDFFGETITVSGLVTGGDLIRQLKNEPLGEALLIPENMVRREGDLFLDNVSITDVEKELHVPVLVNERSGEDFLDKLLFRGRRNL